MATAPQVQRIRINLLPPEIPAARRAKKLIPVAIILILLSVLGTGGWVFMWMRGVTIHEDALADATQKADAVHALESRTSEEQAKVAPLQDMIAFLDQFETHSSKYADVVEAVARYLPASCTIESINVNDDSVQFSTVVGDTEELIKLLINMNRCAMPAEGGGSEPLWSDDAISRGPLTALFSGPIEMSANFGGLTVNETLLPSTDPAQAISGALSSTAPMPAHALGDLDRHAECEQGEHPPLQGIPTVAPRALTGGEVHGGRLKALPCRLRRVERDESRDQGFGPQLRELRQTHRAQVIPPCQGMVRAGLGGLGWRGSRRVVNTRRSQPLACLAR